jgi:ABC-type polysaccharide/polyol phosphate export permease
MTFKEQLLSDSIHSLTVWRVWLFLGKQDIKARFRGSFIGPLWLLLNMTLFVGGVGVVYGLMFGQPMGEFLPFLTAGFIIWGFIVSSLTESGYAFISAEGYIKQFSYPKQIYLLRALVVYTMILLIGLSALIPVQIVFRRFNILGWICAGPGLILLLLAALGHIVIFAYLGVRFRDLPHAMGGVLQVLFFVTPIIFPVKLLAERKLDFVYQYNPLHYLIEIVRYPIMNGEFAPVAIYFFAAIYVVSVWIVAGLVVRRIDARVVYLL